MAEQTQKDDLSHQQLLAAIFGQTRLDKFSSMTSEGKLIVHAKQWPKQFRDCIEAVEGFDEGGGLVREGSRKAFDCVSNLTAHWA